MHRYYIGIIGSSVVVTERVDASQDGTYGSTLIQTESCCCSKVRVNIPLCRQKHKTVRLTEKTLIKRSVVFFLICHFPSKHLGT